MAAPTEHGGLGFDYRLAMGAPDLWIKTLKEKRDEDWDLGELVHTLSSHRPEEKVITYAESHDQALVGDKTLIFRLVDKEMYWHMDKADPNLTVERGVVECSSRPNIELRIEPPRLSARAIRYCSCDEKLLVYFGKSL